ncbi:MAG: hypothetical protein KF754_09150 [Planctomycetes bacterium]|nr:hypothetical protein [Planctomycetota bacterium]
MKPTDFWKNFALLEELQIAGTFIYNGLRRFHELRTLSHADELFEVQYALSVGLERLMKVVVVMLEHRDGIDQVKFERSLITHSHLALLGRIKKKAKFDPAPPQCDLLSVLTTFYSSLRYDHFTLKSIGTGSEASRQFVALFERRLTVNLATPDSMFAIPNEDRFRKFLSLTVLKLVKRLYEIVRERADKLNIFTYEQRSGSKGYSVYMGGAEIAKEEVLWKELLIYFMNTKDTNGYLQFLRSIEPLGFDPGRVSEYLECFHSDSSKAEVLEELEVLYEDLADKGERLGMIGAVGQPGVDFPDDDEEEPGEIAPDGPQEPE